MLANKLIIQTAIEFFLEFKIEVFLSFGDLHHLHHVPMGVTSLCFANIPAILRLSVLEPAFGPNFERYHSPWMTLMFTGNSRSGCGSPEWLYFALTPHLFIASRFDTL